MFFVATGILSGVHDAAAQSWVSQGGNFWRQRSTELPLESPSLAPTWFLPTPGLPEGVALAEIDGDPRTEIMLLGGGRITAFEHEGRREWVTTPRGLRSVLAPVDLDGDQRPELIGRGQPAGVAVVRGRDGKVLWESSLSELGLVGSVLIEDFDRDGLPDAFFAEADCGSPTRGIGRGIAYTFAQADNPVELFRLEENTRNYHCGRRMALADLDGDGRKEILAPSTSHVHVYSSVDGRWLGATGEFTPPLPYGVARLFVEDIDDDGRHEVLLLTNNNYPPDKNSRRAMLLGSEGEPDELAILWDLNVDDVSRDRHAWPNEPLVDLDGNGTMEFIHAFYDQGENKWTTFVRTPASAAVLDRVDGRPVGVVHHERQRPWVLILDEEIGQLRALQVVGSKLEILHELDGDELMPTVMEWRANGSTLSTARTHANSSPYFYLIDKRDAAGQTLSEHRLLAFDSNGVLASEYVYSAQDVLEGSRVGERNLFVHVETDTGTVRRLDGSLREIAGEKPIVSPSQEADELLGGPDLSGQALSLARSHSFFDLSSAHLGRPALRRTRPSSALGLLDANSDGYLDWLVVDRDYRADVDDLAVIDGRTEQVLWAREGLVERSPTYEAIWQANSVVADLSGDSVPDIILQIDEPSYDTLSVVAIDGASGDLLWPGAFELPSAVGGGANPSLAIRTESGPVIVSGIRGELVPIDGADGTLHSPATDVPFSCCLSAWPAGEGRSAQLVLDARIVARWYAFDETLAPLWSNSSIYERNRSRYTGTGASLVRGADRRYIVEGRAAALPHNHNLVVLDADNGKLVHQLVLANGEVRLADSDPTHESLNAGVGFHKTPTSDALYMTSSKSGYLYLLRLGADATHPSYPQNIFVRSWNLGVELGDLSALDVDADGFSEVVVPTLDGQAIILDESDVNTALTVRDTDCETDADVDAITFTDQFCASWNLPQRQVDGYVATLVESDSGSPVSEAVDVGNQTNVRFEDIRLLIGHTYHVRVQAYLGEGTDASVSLPYESDGAQVVDPGEAPVIIGPTAEPGAFVVGSGTSTIRATLQDPSPLAAYSVHIRDMAGNLVYGESAQLNTSEFQIELNWDGRAADGSSLPSGLYRVVVEAVDFSGLRAEAETGIELIDFMDIKVPEEPGCACSSSNSSPRSVPASAFALLVLIAVRQWGFRSRQRG
ncbi:FlgD immunoglobulin-like domain containing protein [Persicimonas caeni]|uniref:FlgD immunoglobulin-like domain containing protein n=1 Tax=Persicimonas caeni TaxID=2292766 RepID=UPI00143D927F|nr:FlgD immunoglobulin-like domain containing protein [Persicimonas caeni]